MYYKDDFYKEFRTEKELCEYLEEIDSRAEWIRITSKKLKVAAAGEETCTEVPDGRWVDAHELAALPMPTAVKTARAWAEKKLTSSSV